MCTETISPFCWWKLLCTWKVFIGRLSEHLHGRQVSYFETCWEGPINHQPRKALLAGSILKLSTNMWHWGRGTINMRLRLLQKNNTTVTGGSSSALAPDSSCNFCSFVSILLLFQQTGYVESLTKGGKLTVTCSGECELDSTVKGQRICSGNKISLFL